METEIMSNVLIGIIGVILFIGLALAGALFLGPRFQESSNDSKAAAYVAQLQQVAHAVSMKRADSGDLADGTVSGTGYIQKLVSDGYLKPVDGGIRTAKLNDSPDTKVAFYILPEEDQSRTVCERIQRQTGQIQAGDPFFSKSTDMHAIIRSGKESGCIRYSYASGQYAAFITI